MPGTALVMSYTVVNKIDTGTCAHGADGQERGQAFNESSRPQGNKCYEIRY